MVPQHGLYSSRVLGLDIAMEGDRLRFYYGTASVPESEDLIARLESMVGELVQRRDEAEQERERAEQERDEALRKVAELEAELARLRKG